MEESPGQESATADQRKIIGAGYFLFKNRVQAAIVIIILALAFYLPSLQNEYALDDGIVIHQNAYVLKGVRGISAILSTDTYHSFYRRMNATDQLLGGRYRPLPSVTYALEQEIIGTYRSGYYQKVEDSNENGVLDEGKVSYTTTDEKQEVGYEYNQFVDKNGDGLAQPDECFNCWDLNKNFRDDAKEDLNSDGVYNEIDCQVYWAFFRHLNNLLLYALCCALLYFLMADHFYKQNHDLAFLSALLFTIHPIHSEVVANVRGRDDLMSMIFIILTFIFVLRFVADGSLKNLFLSGLMFFLALLSKEYAVVLFLLVPLAVQVFARTSFPWREIVLPFLLFFMTAVAMIVIDLYSAYPFDQPALTFTGFIVLFLFLNFLLFKSFFVERKSATVLIMLNMTAIIYLALRLNAVKIAPGVPDTELLNNPYILATGAQAFATKIYSLLIYFKLFIWPHPLVSDYSYATIAYRNLGDWDFILSFCFHLFLLVIGIYLTAKRNPLGYGIIGYLSFILAVSNLFFPTGVMMLESFLFHASIGLCIGFSWLLLFLFEKLKVVAFPLSRILFFGLLLTLLSLSFLKAWERSRDWKNDVTLFLKDVKNAPHSVLVLGNAGARWIDLADTKEITGIVTPGETPNFNDYNGTLKITDEELRAGDFVSKREAALYRGIEYLKHAVELHPRYVNGFLNLGLAYYKLNKYQECIEYWKYAEVLYPKNPYLSNYYEVFGNQLQNKGTEAFTVGNWNAALQSFGMLAILTPNNPEAFYNLGNVHYQRGNFQKASMYYHKAQTLDPSDERFQKALDLPGITP